MSSHKGLIMITGAARSGKSYFAEQWARNSTKTVVFIATLVPQDQEMLERVEHHRLRRPDDWITLEEAEDPGRAIQRYDGPGRIFLLDCLTLLVTNWLLSSAGWSHQEILRRVESLAEIARRSEAQVLVVTNEVGWGIVPADVLSRDYRDIMGRANQIMASWADEVYLMISGLAVELKGLNRSGVYKATKL